MPNADELEQRFHESVQRHLSGNLKEAEEGYRAILRVAPKNVATLVNLGVLLKERGAYEEAERPLKKAVKLAPDYAAGHNNYGTVLYRLARRDEALACYEKALTLEPDYAEAHYNLGLLLRDQRKDEALAHFRRAAALKPDYADARVSVANACRERGWAEEAIEHYERAAAIVPDNDGIKVKSALVLPVIASSREEMERYRARLVNELRRLSERKLHISDPLQEIGQTLFYLAYQGMDDRQINETFARICEHACPELAYVAPHCRAGNAPHRRDPIKVGFVSRYLRGHAVAWCTRNLIRHLQRDGFEVTLFTVEKELDDIWHEMSAEVRDVVYFETEDLRRARELIAAKELDVLIYPDIGMEPLTYFLAFARLARVQCVMPGHPVTTGLTSIDYFLSWGGCDSEDAQACYTERLVRFDGFPAYPRFALPEPRKSRSDYGLPSGKTLYVCPQTPFKFHPDFDDLLAEILRNDPNGDLILFESGAPEWRELLMARLGRAMPDVLQRVRILRRLPIPDFANVLAVCDVALDTVHFGGGNTCFQMFLVGTPIATLPGPFARSRVAAAMYWTMGMSECVANSPEDYVAIALRLGRDPAFRNEIRARILANNSVLFEDPAGLQSLSRFLQAAVKGGGEATAAHG